ncbi:Ger(x)C family spore germination protein [Metabacillus iocasae]|uniref:Spore germination protein n=1 Tax=Priestia iocasae TaxID=2291674 RepID=A0ABS2QW24_9BACI|nr:Ger(x)C family spore germination protein [Metabacillus iocasae]MBM7703478.1 spore germination protein [Metabacillus iocasae]
MRKVAKLFLIISFICITGCVPSKKILEEIQIVQAAGYDPAEGGDENALRGTAGSAYIPPVEGEMSRNIVFSAVGNTSKQIRQSIQSKSSKPIEIGRIGILIFNEELAKKGVMNIIDNFQRDPHIGRDIYLVVSEGSAYDILNADYLEGESSPQYITDIVHQNMDRTIPKVDLHRFLFQHESKGFDPFMPIIKKEKEQIAVQGIALFNSDKYVGRISLKDSYIFKMLFEDIRQGQLETKWKDKYVSIQNLDSNSDYEIRKQNGQYEAKFTIELDGRVSESGGLDLTKKKNIENIERATEKEIKKQVEALLAKFKKLNVDPLGIGDKARQKGLYKKASWNSQYQQLPVKVHVSVNVVQAGIME